MIESILRLIVSVSQFLVWSLVSTCFCSVKNQKVIVQDVFNHMVYLDLKCCSKNIQIL